MYKTFCYICFWQNKTWNSRKYTGYIEPYRWTHRCSVRKASTLTDQRCVPFKGTELGYGRITRFLFLIYATFSLKMVYSCICLCIYFSICSILNCILKWEILKIEQNLLLWATWLTLHSPVKLLKYFFSILWYCAAYSWISINNVTFVLEKDIKWNAIRIKMYESTIICIDTATG